MADRSQGETALVQFNERLTNSAAFGNLFREGMDLVEETAAYLDGDGRTDAKALERSVSLTYATESMRLTTRLMQLASWLLLHRAVKEGEMTLSQANREKTKVKLSAADPGPDDMIEKRPQRSSICWMPPVQAGWDLGSMSTFSLSPSLPQVERVWYSVPSVITTVIV